MDPSRATLLFQTSAVAPEPLCKNASEWFLRPIAPDGNADSGFISYIPSGHKAPLRPAEE